MNAVLAAQACWPDRSQAHVVALPPGSGQIQVGIALAAYALAADCCVLWIAERWRLGHRVEWRHREDQEKQIVAHDNP